ncbi:Modification methylase EcaI [Geodia barretti]|uniref:Modification methylase EcaI n=1 Tax=Geodia barretti TaxID=519541 RepID=A0AA35TFF5_GEOBA|nr:Modification methylase EcaI [Geodia barretti]
MHRPTFNSGRDYNAFIGDSLAQKKAFTDTWTWDTAAQDTRADIEKRAYTSDTYKALDNCLKGNDLVLQNAVSGNSGAMRAYLTFMGPRLAEMHRVLTPTGSIYLHCDPTASHYLKAVLDAVFGVDNFRNEIIWQRTNAHNDGNQYGRVHDTILFYSKIRAFCHVMDQHKAEVGIFITIEPVTAKMRQEAQSMGSFEHNRQSYPRLQFWQIDDTYFENPDVINTLVRLPDAWRIRPTQKSERHFDNQQMQFLRG